MDTTPYIACDCGLYFAAKTVEELVARWNARPAEDALRAEKAELRAALDRANEEIATQAEIIEHLKRSLWLAKHPEHAKRGEPTP